MIYQLPNGKAIEMSLEQFLDMSDEELNYLAANGYGDSIEDPWFGSVLTKNPPKDSEEVCEEFVDSLDTVSVEEKLTNPDIDIDMSDIE